MVISVEDRFTFGVPEISPVAESIDKPEGRAGSVVKYDKYWSSRPAVGEIATIGVPRSRTGDRSPAS